MAGRKTDEQAQATRAAILAAAIDLVSYKGFEGLTIGALAKELEMSKAGILGHFKTKEGLQLATHHEAGEVFRRVVILPAREYPAGLARLRAYCEGWARFIESPPWPGGCVITPASFELDDQPGPVADALRGGLVRWRNLLEREAQLAVEQGELPADTDTEQLAFEIVALATGTVQATRLHRDRRAADRLRRAYDGLLSRPAA